MSTTWAWWRRRLDPAERAFLAPGPGASAWLIEAAASGSVRVRAKMVRAVELAALMGAERVDDALAVASPGGTLRLASICDHLARRDRGDPEVTPDETFSAQPGTEAWASFGR